MTPVKILARLVLNKIFKFSFRHYLKGVLMNIFVNGKQESIEPCTLAQLIAWKNLDAGALVVEINQQIIKQEFWPTTELQDEDRLEMLSFVGGG
jgi:sulfur carrier protein